MKKVIEDVGRSDRIELYTRRWVILFATCLVTVATIFASKSFTVANEIYAAYFGVNLVILDWSCLALYVGATVVTPVFAWLFFKKSVGFRILSISGTSCLLVSYLVIVFAIQFPILYPFMVVSNFLQGVAYTVCFTVGTSFAVLWFPDCQVGIAIACNAISFSVGTLIGAILPPAIFENLEVFKNLSDQQQFLKWKEAAKTDLFWMYTPVLGLLILVLTFFVSYVTDLPPKPPTFALLLKRNLAKNDYGNKSFVDYIAAISKLFKDTTFLLCCLALSIVYNIVIIEIVHITEIVAQFTKRTKFEIPDDVTGGEIITGYSVTCCAAAFGSAAVLNKWKHYFGQTLLGTALSLLLSLGMTFSLYVKSFVGFCSCIFFYGVSTRLFVIPLLEIITRHTFPLEETFVSVWVSGCGCIALVMFAEVARLISLHAKPIGLLIFMCICLLISFCLTLFVRPLNKRGEAFLTAEIEGKNINEKTKLVKNCNSIQNTEKPCCYL